MITCSCGEASNHTVARRKTADGLSVVLWGDGALIVWFGSALEGVPVTRARKPELVALFPTGWKSSSLAGLFRELRKAVAS